MSLEKSCLRMDWKCPYLLILEIPTSDTSSEGVYMSLMSLTLKSESIWNLCTVLPLGVMTMFFLTRYRSRLGWMRRSYLRILLASSLFWRLSLLLFTMVSRNRMMISRAMLLQKMLFM